MHTTTYPIIGLMSGTSGDGLDIAFCLFHYDGTWTFEMPHSATLTFPDTLAYQLSNSHMLSGEALRLLDVAFGKWIGEKVRVFCHDHDLSPIAIASHGHTVFHTPDVGNTFQIGNGWSMHIASGIKVINDFRMLDVQLGGQGAPLVPIGDSLLFPQYDYCLNLGGIANISFHNGPNLVAYDVCPFNLLLNHFAAKTGVTYDENGKMAKSGKPIPELENKLNELAFYKKSGSKSLGREDIDKDFIPLLEKQNENIEDILSTLIAHYTYQISQVIIPRHDHRLLITGGGAYHSYFIDQLKLALEGKVQVVLPDRTLIDFKEALIFGFLGVLRLRGEINCLSTVTGASRDSIGGVIYG
ncbi:anhydro-N-acetylmuramic acid kinase [Anditalea andensis]|uniref:Anhydro-N-acetylmuramic acid kinase n=1 Tax=Anditalea andensis TaxID=1048983 RepID=A0A074LHB3_9BACT|nr:anhydro-N-acetylmuramic acid kinase [Anditalea andensis]KEO73162.1 anhydro-N-acetylmuramic acid kinase [Anditalea andensis]